MTVTRSNAVSGSEVASALAHENFAIARFALTYTRFMVMLRFPSTVLNAATLVRRNSVAVLAILWRWERKLAMEIISGEVSTPIRVSASGKACCKARVESPTPQQRSTTRGFPLSMMVANSVAIYRMDMALRNYVHERHFDCVYQIPTNCRTLTPS